MSRDAVTIIGPEHLTRSEWATRLNEQWDQIRESAVAGFLQLGRDLKRAKADLGQHGGWIELLNNDLKFHPRIAQKFMRITSWVSEKRLNESHLSRLLPPDYNTIVNI